MDGSFRVPEVFPKVEVYTIGKFKSQGRVIGATALPVGLYSGRHYTDQTILTRRFITSSKDKLNELGEETSILRLLTSTAMQLVLLLSHLKRWAEKE